MPACALHRQALKTIGQIQHNPAQTLNSVYCAVLPDKILYSGQAMVFLHDCRPMLCYIISIFINRISAKSI